MTPVRWRLMASITWIFCLQKNGYYFFHLFNFDLIMPCFGSIKMLTSDRTVQGVNSRKKKPNFFMSAV